SPAPVEPVFAGPAPAPADLALAQRAPAPEVAAPELAPETEPPTKKRRGTGTDKLETGKLGGKKKPTGDRGTDRLGDERRDTAGPETPTPRRGKQTTGKLEPRKGVLGQGPKPLPQRTEQPDQAPAASEDADAAVATAAEHGEVAVPAVGGCGWVVATGAGAAEEPFVNFLDELLDEPAPIERHKVRPATDTLFDDAADAALDPNFAALPEVPPEIEAAFASLSEADVMTFLTLDGDAAMAFLQSRIARPGQEPPASAAPS